MKFKAVFVMVKGASAAYRFDDAEIQVHGVYHVVKWKGGKTTSFPSENVLFFETHEETPVGLTVVK